LNLDHLRYHKTAENYVRALYPREARGFIQKQMVRINSQSDVGEGNTIEYADWMGTKHLSAIEVSVRSAVVAAVPLSKENGRVSIFQDGDYKRDELGGVWRPSE
jgi:hypothetical protein